MEYLTYRKMKGSLFKGVNCIKWVIGINTDGSLVSVPCGSPRCPICGQTYTKNKTEAIEERYMELIKRHGDNYFQCNSAPLTVQPAEKLIDFQVNRQIGPLTDNLFVILNDRH